MKYFLFLIFCITVGGCTPKKRGIIDNKNPELPFNEEDAELVKLGDTFSIDLLTSLSDSDFPGYKWEATYDKEIFQASNKSRSSRCATEEKSFCLTVISYEFKAIKLGKAVIKFQLKDEKTVIQSHVRQVVVTKDGNLGSTSSDSQLDSYLSTLPETLSLEYQKPVTITLKSLPSKYQYQFVANTSGIIISQAKQKDQISVTISPQAIGKSAIVVKVVDAALREYATLIVLTEVKFSDTYHLSVNEPFLIRLFSQSVWQVSQDNDTINVNKEGNCADYQNTCQYVVTATAAGAGKVVFASDQGSYTLSLTADYRRF